MLRICLIVAVVLCLVLVLLPLQSLSQVDYSTATLKGTVFDPQGLLIPDASVTVKNPNTGFAKTVKTGADGIYQLPLLQPGTYQVQVQATGFSTTLGKVALSVGQVANYDVRLKMGATTETVEVTEQALLVQVEQTQQANTIELTQIAELPNISRSFTDSVFTLPGVSKSEAPRAQNPGFSGFQSSGFSIGGSNGRNNLVTIDGGENDYGSGQLRTPHVPVDSIQEFQVNRSSFAAEFGFTAGTAINIVTKGGTNNFHGSVYAFFRNEHTDASNYFAPKTAEKAFEQNFVPGVTFGGPLIKNKLFLFSAFEYVKQDTPQFRNYTTADAAQGFNSKYAPGPAQRALIANLMNSGNPLLQGLAGQLQFALTPSNFPNGAKLLVPNTGAFNDWKKFKNWITRVDYQPTANDTITARFSLMDDDSSRMYILDPLNSPDDATIQYWRDYTLLGSWNHVFSPRFVNQLRVQAVPSDIADVRVASPNTAYLRIGSLGQFRGEHYEPYYAVQRRFQFEDSMTWTLSRHTLKFGASYRPVSYSVNDKLWFGGEFQFVDGKIPLAALVPTDILISYPQLVPLLSSDATNLSAFQAFTLNIPASYRQGFGNPQWADWGHYLGAYGQDSWKLGRNLTLDFGGRIDYDAEPAPLPHHVYFSPRLGIAWNPDGNGKTVVRAGGGVFVAPVNFFIDYIVNLLNDSGKYINQVASILRPGVDTTILNIWGYGVQTGKLPFSQLTAADLAALGLTIGPNQPGRIVLQPSPDYKNTYSVQASLSVQRQLARNMSVELAYQMYHGLHIQLPRDGNVEEVPCPGPNLIDPFTGPCYTQIDPTIVQREVYSSIGKSIYHGMTASLIRRSARMQLQASYTFSKTIDDNTDFNNDFMPFRPTRMNLERGLSAFSIKHNFVASAVYATPFAAGAGNFLTRAFADMTISPILSMRSGIPFTVRVPGIDNGTLGQNLYARPWHAGRNTGIGPNFYGLDLRVTKSFFVNREKGVKVDFLAEGTNILNHTNFSSVNDVFPAIREPFQLGPYTVDLLNGPYNFSGTKALDASQPLGFKSAFDPRQVQFGLKVIF